MIVVTVFLSILNQMKIHVVESGEENYLHDHVPFILEWYGNLFSGCNASSRRGFFSCQNECFFLQCCGYGQRMQNMSVLWCLVPATVLWCLVPATVQVSKRSCYLKKSSSSVLGHLQTETFFIVDRPQTLLRLSRHNGVPVNSPLKPLNPIVLWWFEQL